jgi:multiple sugar transport system permease protein
MVLEGFDIDLAPLFSGKAVRIIGGVPFESGGIFPTAIHYIDQLTLANFPHLVLNSTAIALIGVGVGLLVGLPAAYALSRLRLRGKGVFSFLILALRTVSPFAVILPLYLLYVDQGLWDTYVGLGVAYLVVVLPVIVWLLKGFIDDVPKETYEAAETFGASERQVFMRVCLPIIIPGIAVTAVFAFALIWNEFLIASVLTGPVTKTVSVGVWAGTGEASGFRSVNWDDLNAAGALATIPAMAMLLAIRKYLAKGFSLATAR